jgi:hypothetical protein
VFETLAAVGIAAGVVFVIRLIAGPDTDESALIGIFTSAPMPARPRGVQETDLAAFAFRDPQPVASSSAQVHVIDGRMDPARAA